MRQIPQWESPGIGACSLRLRRIRTPQRYCVKAPWRHLAGSWVFTRFVDFAPTAAEDTPNGESGRTLYPGRGRSLHVPIGECVEMS